MRVRCVSLQYIVASRSKTVGSLTIGKEYVALELLVMSDGAWVRVLTDQADFDEGDLDHAIYPMTLFEVTDSKLSRRWQIAADPEGNVSLGPPEWQSRDFWDRLFGDLPFVLGKPDVSAYGSFSLQTQALVEEDAASQSSPGDIPAR